MPKSYIICATPRTGSTLLCDLLTATEVAGAPDSFFMRDVDPAWAKAWDLPARGTLREADFSAAYLQAAVRAGKGHTGIFGLRLMRENLDDLSALIGKVFPGLPSDRARFEAAFGQVLYIHLSREDKVAQAVSLVKAEQTGLWHVAPDGTEIERLAPQKAPVYDFDRIARQVALLQHADRAWETWFDGENIRPLRVTYETLAVEPATVLKQICAALNLAAPAKETLRPTVARVSDAVNEAWMRRYRRDLETSAPR
jgi:trehalose 2-sulfotransferase